MTLELIEQLKQVSLDQPARPSIALDLLGKIALARYHNPSPELDKEVERVWWHLQRAVREPV